MFQEGQLLVSGLLKGQKSCLLPFRCLNSTAEAGKSAVVVIM
jgi:hypothetical protein